MLVFLMEKEKKRKNGDIVLNKLIQKKHIVKSLVPDKKRERMEQGREERDRRKE